MAGILASSWARARVLNADGTLPYQQQTVSVRGAFAGMMEYAPHKNLMFQMVCIARRKSTLLAVTRLRLVRYRGRCNRIRRPYRQSNRISDNWQALFSGYGGLETRLAGSTGHCFEGLDVVTTSFDVGLLGSHILEKRRPSDYSVRDNRCGLSRVALDLSYVS